MTLPDTDPPAALDRLAAANPAAASLLLLCGFLDPDHPIPVAALEAGAAALPQPLAAALLDAAAREPLWDALLYAAAGGVARGELVVNAALARAAADRVDADARRSWAEAAAQVMEKAFPTDPVKPESHPTCERLLPHARAATGHAEQAGAGLAPAAQVLHLAGRYLLEVLADPAAATDLLTRAAALRARAHGAGDVRVAWDLTYLNGALLQAGDWGVMARNAVRSAEILEAAAGPRDQIVITHVNNAALLLLRAGDTERARTWFNRALGMAEPVFGGGHPFVATILSNLGDLHAREGDGEGARHAYRKALMIDEKAYGPRHNSVARDLAKLGELLAAAGEGEAARPYLRRAAEWFTERDGADDARVLALRATLARIDAAREADTRSA
ncbi:MAG TPA: tetratricopeptide repeat protein [Longimicrobium sp.]|nr:tetratricopeptide repeat protein [Longimicrobium sp.]